MNQKTLLLSILALIVSVGFTRQVFAQEGEGSPDFIKSRSYIGVLGTSATIDHWGDFQGIHYVTSIPVSATSGSTNNERDFIPSIDRNFGFGVLLGHREGPWAAEVSFWRSDHTATGTYVLTAGVTTTLTDPASLQAINVDFKRYFFTQLPTQPFINIGISFPWLWVQDFSWQLDSSNNPTGRINNETISGIGLNLGAGLEIYLDNGFSILGGLYQRWTEFNQVSGYSKIAFNQIYYDGNPSDIGAYEGDGLNLYVGTTFGFQ